MQRLPERIYCFPSRMVVDATLRIAPNHRQSLCIDVPSGPTPSTQVQRISADEVFALSDREDLAGSPSGRSWCWAILLNLQVLAER
jgi:hypothetical protein